jgi:hypothetical protein
MPSIRLRFPRAWYQRIEKAAERSNQTPEQLLQGLISLSIAPPRMPSGARVPTQQALVYRVEELCKAIDTVRNDLVGALNGIARQPRRNPRIAALRAEWSSRLRSAMKRKGLTQQRTADYLGVSRSAVAKVLVGTNSLPEAWMEPLDNLFGKGWLNDD